MSLITDLRLCRSRFEQIAKIPKGCPEPWRGRDQDGFWKVSEPAPTASSALPAHNRDSVGWTQMREAKALVSNAESWPSDDPVILFLQFLQLNPFTHERAIRHPNFMRTLT